MGLVRSLSLTISKCLLLRLGLTTNDCRNIFWSSNAAAAAAAAVVVRRWKASLIATLVVVVLVLLLLVTRFRKMPKALLIRNGKLRNLAYTFVTSLPPGLPS